MLIVFIIDVSIRNKYNKLIYPLLKNPEELEKAKKGKWYEDRINREREGKKGKKELCIKRMNQ